MDAKRELKTALVMLVLVCVLCSAAFGQAWDGNGVEGDPYQIWDACDMQAIGADSNYWDAHFLLCADIDLGSYTGTTFNIIGEGGSPFTGVFDGNGHTISNFTYACTGTNNIGLIGYITGAVSDLHLVDPNVDAEGGWCVGSLAGKVYFGAIIGCSAEGGTVSGGDYSTGGLVGLGGGNILSSFATTTVSGVAFVGGLVGECDGDIENCYSTGSVSGNGQVGGLVGRINKGDIYHCYSAGIVTGGGSHTGGLVGRAYDAASATNSFWDVNSSSQGTSAIGRGKTIEQMQSAETFVGWGCVPVWTIDDGNDYPRLLWENKPGEILDAELSDFVSGSGEANDPYLIHTSEELNLIGAFPCDWDKHFRLMGDIDLVGYAGDEFNIIGNYNNYFRGLFDGNGHKISNFTYSSTGTNNIGLFGGIGGEDAEVKDLGLIDPNIDAGTGSSIGSLVGWLAYGTVSGCYVDGGTVSGEEAVGGLVGRSGSSVVSRSYTSSVVSGVGNVGGLIGHSESDIFECYATGGISGGDYIGGLVGWTSSGDVTNCHSSGSVLGSYAVGGLAGTNWKHSRVANSYSTGGVSGVSSVGGLVGLRSRSTVENSFWDVNSSGVAISAGGTGLTTAEMQTRSTFTDAGWDFVGEVINGPNDIWRLCNEGIEYAQLNWQYLLGDFGCPDGVDWIDVGILCEEWLFQELSADVWPDGGDGFVDFLDWAVFAEGWGDTDDIFDLADFAEQWLKSGSNYLITDIAPGSDGDGITNGVDFAALADNWLAGI